MTVPKGSQKPASYQLTNEVLPLVGLEQLQISGDLPQRSESGELHHLGLQPELLTDPVHPIFRRENFLKGINYDRLLPALRLASRLLTASHLQSLWFAYLYCNVRPAEGQHGVRRFFVDSDPDRVDPQDVRNTSWALDRLAGAVKFAPYPKDAPARAANAQAYTAPIVEAPAPAPLAGRCSAVFIRPDLLGNVYLANMANKDRDAAIWPYFALAKTLVHELGHAALIAARKEGSKGQWFFDGCSTSEQGYEIEVKLFGGLIKKTAMTGSPVLILADWPSKPDMGPASCYAQHAVASAREGKTLRSTVRLVPRHHIAACLTNEFWERSETLAKLGCNLLQPPMQDAVKYHTI